MVARARTLAALWLCLSVYAFWSSEAFRAKPIGGKNQPTKDTASSPNWRSASRDAMTTRGGGAESSDADDSDDNDGGKTWELPVKKVMIALGAFALQQTLTRMNDNGQLRRLPRQRDAPLMVQDSSGPSSVGLLEAAPDQGGGVAGDLADGGATMTQHVFNMVKSIVGVGVLSLPAGIAAFGNARSAVLPAVVIVAFMGILSAIGFSWTGQVCAVLAKDETVPISTPTYRQAWSYSVSEETSWIPAISTTSMTFIACLCFSMVLADSLTDLVKPVIKGAGRGNVLWVTSTLVLLPLCWMKNLASLAPFSFLGVLGMLYTGLAMAGRLLHGSYEMGSPLLSSISEDMRPSFGTDGWKAVFKPGSIILVSMLSTAYMCHYNAPKFYNELKDNTVPRFNKATAAGFGISIAISAAIAAVGFLTFGSGSNGFVLNNYASNDFWMSLSRVAVAVSLTFSYPLCFQGLREGVLDVLRIPPEDRTSGHMNAATFVLLFALTALATVLKDVSIVLALTGATLGNLLCYIYPALMFGRVNPTVRAPAVVLGTLGVLLGVIGVKLALEAASS